MHDFRRIVILTGAGVSAESGLGTFRDKDGLWTRYDLRDVATPEGFRRNPDLVRQFYSARRANLAGATPNAAHHALARLEAAWPGQVMLVTQNVDDLHEQAGSRNLVHMHGELLRTRCTACGDERADRDALTAERACRACGQRGTLRPAVVWFGEMPLHMERIGMALMECDLFVAIGTSGNVYPAAGFVNHAKFAGAETLEINNAETIVSDSFGSHRIGPASVEVPRWVDEVLLR